MRYPVLILTIISVTGTVAAVWALALGRYGVAALSFAASVLIARLALQRYTHRLQRRVPPGE